MVSVSSPASTHRLQPGTVLCDLLVVGGGSNTMLTRHKEGLTPSTQEEANRSLRCSI
jgi:hypothetical protein